MQITDREALGTTVGEVSATDEDEKVTFMKMRQTDTQTDRQTDSRQADSRQTDSRQFYYYVIIKRGNVCNSYRLPFFVRISGYVEI